MEALFVFLLNLTGAIFLISLLLALTFLTVAGTAYVIKQIWDEIKHG